MKQFLDKQVSLVLKSIKSQANSNSTFSLENVTFVCKILEYDDTFVYVSQNGDGMDAAIALSEIAMILDQQSVEMFEMLDSADDGNVQ